MTEFYKSAYLSSPGRILGLVFLLAAAILWLYAENKKNKERKARRLAKQQAKELEATKLLENNDSLKQ